MVDVGQNQLQGASFGPQHQIDVLDVPLKSIVDLFFCQKHQADHSHAKCQERQAQGSLQWLGLEILPSLIEEPELHKAWLFKVTQLG